MRVSHKAQAIVTLYATVSCSSSSNVKRVSGGSLAGKNKERERERNRERERERGIERERERGIEREGEREGGTAGARQRKRGRERDSVLH